MIVLKSGEVVSFLPFNKVFGKLHAVLLRKYSIFLILLIGIVLRIITFTRISIWYDGAMYTDIGWGILEHGTFVTATDNVPTWGFSLTYPLYLSIFYNLLGYNVFSTYLGSLIAGTLAILVVYLTTADIFGKRKGLIAATIIALNPWVIFTTGANYTENLLIIFLSLTLWALLKSSENRRYLAVSGVFAALTYLTKTNIGISLVIIATIFFVIWRLYHQKKRVLKDPYLIFFIAIVLVSALARNYMISQMPYHVSEESTAAPSLLTSKGIVQLAFELPFHLLLPATYFLFFMPETSKAISHWKSEKNSLLMLVLLGGIGLILLHAVARQTWLQTLPGASERYFTTFIVPTIWLFFGYLRIDEKNPFSTNDKKTEKVPKIITFGRLLIKKKKICFLFSILIGVFILFIVDLWWGLTLSIGSFSFFMLRNVHGRVTLFMTAILISGVGSTLDYHYTLQFADAMDDMHNYVNEGDIIAIDSDNVALSLSSVSLYLSDINVEVIEYDPQRPFSNYILSQKSQRDVTYENYTLLKTYNDTSPLHLRAWIYSELNRRFIDEDFEWSRFPPIEVWVKD